MTENNLPNVWDKANKNDTPNWLNPKEGHIWFSPLEPEKLRIYKNEKWQEIDPFVDLEERKVKKPEETND